MLYVPIILGGMGGFGLTGVLSRDLKNNQLVGDLTFLGRTKEIGFPVIISDESISADFIIDTSLFGEMSDLANDEVRIFFELVK